MKSFYIQTDASITGIGAVIYQEENGIEHPIAFTSRTHERKYSVTEKEFLAVMFGIEKFRCYVEGTFFYVVMDHRALK